MLDFPFLKGKTFFFRKRNTKNILALIFRSISWWFVYAQVCLQNGIEESELSSNET